MFKRMFSSSADERKLGNIGTGPSSSLLQQLEVVREKINKTSNLAGVYKNKFDELSAFNERLTYGYINNLNVIVDISYVLNEYKLLMTSVLEQLQQFDSTVVDDFKKINIEHIRELTSEKLNKVANFFNSDDFLKLKETLISQGKTDAASKINETEHNFKSIQTAAQGTLISMQSQRGGIKSKHKSKAKIRQLKTSNKNKCV